MALTHQRITVSTTAVPLNTAGPAGGNLVISNVSANPADIGASNVTGGTGLAVPAAVVTVRLGPGDVVYGIRSAAADAVLAVLRT